MGISFVISANLTGYFKLYIGSINMLKTEREKLDDVANEIWVKKKFFKTSSCWGSEKYALTENQFDLINTATETFKEIYREILAIYKATEETTGILSKIGMMVDRYFSFGRLNTGMSNTNVETTGFARGLFVFFQLYKDEKRKNESQKKLDIKKEMQPLIDFFGDSIESSRELFEKFTINIAIRFQSVIELLDRDPEGLANFANYIPFMLLQKAPNKLNEINVSSYNSESKKIEKMAEILIKHDEKNIEYDAWKYKTLKTVGKESVFNTNRLEIDLVLTRSPIDSPIDNIKLRGFWAVKGNDKKILALPIQLCSEDEKNGYKVNHEFQPL